MRVANPTPVEIPRYAYTMAYLKNHRNTELCIVCHVIFCAGKHSQQGRRVTCSLVWPMVSQTHSPMWPMAVQLGSVILSKTTFMTSQTETEDYMYFYDVYYKSVECACSAIHLPRILGAKRNSNKSASVHKRLPRRNKGRWTEHSLAVRMWIQVRTMDGRKSARIDSLSKLTTIEQLREKLVEEFDAEPERQRLFYRGKQVSMGMVVIATTVTLHMREYEVIIAKPETLTRHTW